MRFIFLLSLLSIGCAKATVEVPDEDSGMTTADGGTPPPCTTMCSGMCSDPKTDNKNCGKCGTVCPMGATCTQGTCQCGSGQTKCGSACVDTKTDNTNCGKCSNICGQDAGSILGGGMWACTAGACTIVCPNPKIECSGACVDTKSDNDNCGMCGMACTPNTQQCTEGQCCNTGEKICNNKCTDVQNDSANCGMCGKVCSGNTPTCVNGTCTSAPCSTVAKNYCTGMGWKVVQWSTSWPNMPGGSIFCTIDGRSAANDCDGCGTYKQIVWKNSAKDACNSPMQMQPGNVYTGHSPCTCAANNPNCGQWPMNNCTPD